MGRSDELDVIEDRSRDWVNALSALVALQGSVVAVQLASALAPGAALSCRGTLGGGGELFGAENGPLALYIDGGVITLWPQRFVGGQRTLWRVPQSSGVYRSVELDFADGVSVVVDELSADDS